MHWPIFVVSLSDAHERRESITRQFREHGLEFEFVDAVDGRNGLPAEYESKIDRAAARARMKRDLSDAEFACALSHQSIYERIVAGGGLPGAIVLEDDVILTDAFIEFIREGTFVDHNFIQMFYSGARRKILRKSIRSRQATLAPLSGNAYSTAGYALSASAAQYILSNSRPLAGTADWPCDLGPIRPMATIPRLLLHPERIAGQSSLQDARQASGALATRISYLRAGESSHQIRWKRLVRPEFWRYVGKELGFSGTLLTLWRRLTTRRIEGPTP